MAPSAWEAIFMLLVLKIPIVYLALVVWWAIKAEPQQPEGAALHARPEGEGGPQRFGRGRRPRGFRPGPHGSPVRGYTRRGAFVRARVERR